MLLSLTETGEEGSQSTAKKSVVGGKAASLAKLFAIPALHGCVPKSYCLTVDFFRPWVQALQKEFESDNLSSDATVCIRINDACLTLPMNASQKAALEDLSGIVKDAFRTNKSASNALAAVRSSAPEEDGGEHSFAGMFTTKLGVTPDTLEQAVRECFASRFDPRVLAYMAKIMNGTTNLWKDLSFAVVVMEMVDSKVAGVAFSANPLNSDRDELVIDSSFGLGESVVDGSVTADRYLYDKIGKTILAKTIGAKTQEKKLLSTGGVEAVCIPNCFQDAGS